MRNNEPTNNQSINSTSSNDNLLRHFLAFQLAFINSTNLFSSPSQVSFNSSTHFSNLFLSYNQVSFNSSTHFSIPLSSSSQVSFNSSAMFVSFIPSAVKHFLQLLFRQSLHFYKIIYLDSRELSREPRNSLCLIKKFDFSAQTQFEKTLIS